MKKLILKSGVGQHKNQHYEATHGEVDMRRWLYSQLKAFHLDPSDDCCETYVPPVGVDTDTRLTNPHVVGPNMVFDLLNVTNSTTTPNFISIPLSSLNINTTLVDNGNGTATYTNEAGVATTITLGLPETQTTLDSATLTAGNLLEIQYTGENGTPQTVSVDLSTLAIDINVASVAYNPLNGEITLTETDGSVHTIDIGPFAETITTLIDNADGSFTYTNEAGASVTWNETNTTITNTVVGNKIADYTNENGTVTPINETITTLNDFTLVGNTLGISYVDETGTTISQDIDLTSIIPVETITSLDVPTLAGNILSIKYTAEDAIQQVQTIDLSTLNTVQTQLVANDSDTIDFTVSGTDNHTITADVKLDNTGNVNFTTSASGIKGNVTFPTVVSSLNGATGNVTNSLTLGSAGTTPSITGSGTNNITLDLPTANTVNTGKVSNTDYTSFLDKVGLADNGLSLVGSGLTNKVQLGGNLVKNTAITNNGFNLDIVGTVPSRFSSNGQASIGTLTPTTDYALTVNNSTLNGGIAVVSGSSTTSNIISLENSANTNILNVQSAGDIYLKNNRHYIHYTANNVPMINSRLIIGDDTPTDPFTESKFTVYSPYSFSATYNKNISSRATSSTNTSSSHFYALGNLNLNNNTGQTIFYDAFPTTSANPIHVPNSFTDVVGFRYMGSMGGTFTGGTLGQNTGFLYEPTLNFPNVTSIARGIWLKPLITAHPNYRAIEATVGNVLLNTVSGNTGIGITAPSEKLHVVGNILATGTITPSDIRIKENINDFKGGLNKIVALEPKTYQIKKDSQMGVDSTILKAGFIAQDIEAIFGENSIIEFNHTFSTIKEVTETEYKSYSDVDYFKEIVNRDIYTTELVYDKNNEPVYEDEVQKTEQVFSHTETVYQIKGIKNVKAPKQEFIICSLVNAIKELNQQIIDLKAANNLI